MTATETAYWTRKTSSTKAATVIGAAVRVRGGIATAAEYGVYGPEGEWLIEGHGVEPDIVVDNLPHETYNGKSIRIKGIVRDAEPVSYQWDFGDGTQSAVMKSWLSTMAFTPG